MHRVCIPSWDRWPDNCDTEAPPHTHTHKQTHTYGQKDSVHHTLPKVTAKITVSNKQVKIISYASAFALEKPGITLFTASKGTSGYNVASKSCTMLDRVAAPAMVPTICEGMNKSKWSQPGGHTNSSNKDLRANAQTANPDVGAGHTHAQMLLQTLTLQGTRKSSSVTMP